MIHANMSKYYNFNPLHTLEGKTFSVYTWKKMPCVCLCVSRGCKLRSLLLTQSTNITACLKISDISCSFPFSRLLSTKIIYTEQHCAAQILKHQRACKAACALNVHLWSHIKALKVHTMHINGFRAQFLSWLRHVTCCKDPALAETVYISKLVHISERFSTMLSMVISAL